MRTWFLNFNLLNFLSILASSVSFFPAFYLVKSPFDNKTNKNVKVKSENKVSFQFYFLKKFRFFGEIIVVWIFCASISTTGYFDTDKSA